jgi:post-segregation antitoxin (ccd killing protein)
MKDKKKTSEHKVTVCVSTEEREMVQALREEGINISFMVRKAIKEAHDRLVKEDA